MKKIVIATFSLWSALVGFSCAAAWSDVDLENCRWKTGLPLTPKACAGMRQMKAEEDAKKEKDRKEHEELVARNSEFEAQQKAKEEAWQQKIDQQKAEREKEAAEAEDRQRKADEEWDRQDQSRQKKAAAAVAEKKKQCGDDYQTPKIGMAIERARQCVGNIKMTGQLNRADGVVSTYEIRGKLYLHVMNGRVVSWGKY